MTIFLTMATRPRGDGTMHQFICSVYGTREEALTGQQWLEYVHGRCAYVETATARGFR